MKLSEAIKRLELDIANPGSVAIENVNEAEQLGIEAMKWRKLMEDDYGPWCGPLLPGETKE